MRGWKRIAAVALALWVVLIVLHAYLGAHWAHSKTESLLDYAIRDFIATFDDYVDAGLAQAAKSAVAELSAVSSATTVTDAEATRLARLFLLDELNVVDASGIVRASNDPDCRGADMKAHPLTAAFLALTNGTTHCVAQPFRKGIANPASCRKYLGWAFPDRSGFIQVGLDITRLGDLVTHLLVNTFKDWEIGEQGYYVCSDASGERILYAPEELQATGRTLASLALPADLFADKRGRRTFTARLFGRRAFLRHYAFAGFHVLAVVPYAEFYVPRNRNFGFTAFGLFTILGIVSLIVRRMLADGRALKNCYAADVERRAGDLKMAHTIQMSVLPNVFPPYPNQFEFDIFGTMKPAREVGGDFYDFFFIDRTHLVFVVADVSGKGVPGALFMMNARTTIRSLARSHSDPAALLEAANARLAESNDAEMFVTAWLGILDTSSGVVSYANGGHNPPMIRRADGTVETLRGKHGLVLAALPKVAYAAQDFALAPGDTLFLYTDGVTEAVDTHFALYGEERLRTCLAGAKTRLCQAVGADLERFAEGAEQADDITMLALDWYGAPRLSERTFPASAEGLAEAAAFLETALEEAHTPPAEAAKLQIACDEIVSNIVKFSGSPDFTVRLEYAAGLGARRLTFIDAGPAWNPLAHVDPDITLSAEKRPIGGLGILMVKRLMDDVSYAREDERNILAMRKVTRRQP